MTVGIKEGAGDGGRPGRTAASGRRGGVGLRGWRGLALVLAVLLGALLAAAAASSLSLEAEAARRGIKAELVALTGLPVTIDGASDFTLLPRTALTLTKIRIGAGGADADAVLEIDALRADFDLWQALLGHARIKRLTVVRPELLSTDGFMNEASSSPPSAGDGGGQRRPARAQAEAGGPDERGGYLAVSRFFGAFLPRFGDLRAIEVRDGVFRMAGGEGGLGISNANIVVSWPSRQAAARLAGSYVWNGEPTEIDLRLDAPVAFLNGGESAVDFSLSSPPLDASFTGRGALGGAGALGGRLRLAVPSLTRSVRWLGDPRAALPDVGPLSVEADLAAGGRAVALRNAAVSLGGSPGGGALEMRLDDRGRPSIGGTLAFDRLDIGGLAEAVAPLPDTALGLQRPIPVGFIGALDLDLRVSAARAGMGEVAVEDLAATLKFKDGTATLDVGDAALLGGSGQARLSLDTRSRSPAAKGSATLRGVDPSALLAAIGVSAVGVSGRADVDAALEAPATSWADIVRRGAVALTLSARAGALSGFDPATFPTEGTRPFALASSPASIPFETLQATLKTTGPLVSLQALVLKGPSGDVLASGVLSAATKQVDVTGTFDPAGAAPSPGTAFTLSKPIAFRMRGTWPRPDVTTGPPAKPI